MTDPAETLSTALFSGIPLVPIGLGVLAVVFLFFSFSMTYHWVLYNKSVSMTVGVLATYYGVSLALIGFILISLAYAP